MSVPAEDTVPVAATRAPRAPLGVIPRQQTADPELVDVLDPAGALPHPGFAGAAADLDDADLDGVVVSLSAVEDADLAEVVALPVDPVALDW
ncbi:hypothetical protein [Cellulomonas hominis]|nr:hypothetical protein [Cellulomonas hominis]NKY09478.1 hypothetical protein [Cellulomonas hominis]